jgi:Translocon-associated protein (TRAP), alpha subunit
VVSFAEEDPLEDEGEADVEGEADIEEVATTEEEEEEPKTTASPDADTTILFVKPLPTGASQLGKMINLMETKQK